MSLVILADVRIKSDAHDAVRAAGVKMCAATMLEPGCHRYNFAFDMAEPDLVRISEEWESDAALTEHFASPHMAEFQSALKNLAVAGGGGSKYEFTSKGPIR